jgi:prepilin-type N-terminal cleavage/methylation domain-containing protein
MKRLSRPPSKARGTFARAGFTLVETVIALAVFSAIMILVTLFGLDIADFTVQFQQRLASQDELQLAITKMTSEFRSATYASNGSYPVVLASSTSFSFYTDVDATGTIEFVRYFAGTSTLQKGITRATGTPAQYLTSTEIVSPVISNVVTSSFLYYDSAYSGTESPMAFPISDISVIRAVRFTVTVDQATTTRPGAVTSSITVTLRNLRTN